MCRRRDNRELLYLGIPDSVSSLTLYPTAIGMSLIAPPCSFGVFQTVYEETTLKSYTPSTISWIFTIQLSLMWLLSPLFGRVLDTYGPKPILIPCSILCVFSLCMLSLSSEYYQIFLSQGLGFSIGAGGIFTTSYVITGQWFVKQRGLAMGIVTCGSSLGQHLTWSCRNCHC